MGADGSVPDGSGNADWDAFRTAIETDAGLKSEITDAYRGMLHVLNPTDRGIRFAIGSMSEWIVASGMYVAGVIALPEGHGADGVDLSGIKAQAKEAFSVKSSFRDVMPTFRLSNGLGGRGRGFAHPTIFVAPALGGLVFADPAIHKELAAKVKNQADAVVLSGSAVLEHAKAHPECFIEIEIPPNPKTGAHDPTAEFAEAFFMSGRFPLLAKVFVDRAAAATPNHTLAAALADLRADYQAGVISKEAYEQLALALVNLDETSAPHG